MGKHQSKESIVVLERTRNGMGLVVGKSQWDALQVYFFTKNGGFVTLTSSEIEAVERCLSSLWTMLRKKALESRTSCVEVNID